MPPLPRLQLDVGAGVAVDLPRRCNRRRRRRSALALARRSDRQRLPFDPPPRPAPVRPQRPRSRERWRGEALDSARARHRRPRRAALAFGAKLRRIGQRERPPPQLERRFAGTWRRPPQARSAPRVQPRRSPARAPARPPPTPAATAARTAPRPKHCWCPGRSAARNPLRSAPHIWRPARHARNRRRWAGSAGWPAASQRFAVGRAIIGHDQVEIEHQPVELLLRAGTIRRTAPRATPSPCFAAIASAIAVTRGSTGRLSSSATSARSSRHGAWLRPPA